MKDLTQGRIDLHLLRMSGAFLLNMLMGVLFSLANLYWVGHLGAHAQAALVLAGLPVMLLLTLMPVVSVGAGIRIAHAVGAQDQPLAERIFNEAFGAALIGIAIVAAVAWTQRDAVGRLMTGDARTVALIAEYYRWFIPSVVVQLPLFVMAIALEFTGDVRAGTLAQTAVVVLNAVLAPVLMFGWLGLPPLGLTGTGLASFVACGLTMLGLAVYVARPGAYLRLRPAVWLSRPRELWSALKIGLPTGMEGALVAGYLMVIALLLRPFGPEEQAAFGIGHRVFQAALMPLMALSSALGVLVGQSHGAGLHERVRATLRSGLLLGLAVAPVLLAVIEAFAPWICARFSDDAAVIAAGSAFLRIGALTLIPSAIAYVAFAVLAGTGNTRPSLYTQLVYASLVVLPALLLASVPGFAPRSLWWVMVGAGCVQAAMAAYFLRRQFGPRALTATLPAATTPAALPVTGTSP